jgi:hypothetical protein
MQEREGQLTGLRLLFDLLLALVEQEEFKSGFVVIVSFV